MQNGMRFTAGLMTGLAVAFSLPAMAQDVQQQPPGVPYWPEHTIMYDAPRGCSVVKSIPTTKYTANHELVRELIIYRLACDHGDRRRTHVVRGPWMQAFFQTTTPSEPPAEGTED